jgi:hypothetical protein
MTTGKTMHQHGHTITGLPCRRPIFGKHDRITVRELDLMTNRRLRRTRADQREGSERLKVAIAKPRGRLKWREGVLHEITENSEPRG